MSEPDGGPAFPFSALARRQLVESIYRDNEGMSLRDWFAGQALAGLCARTPDASSAWAYQLADAMLAERSK